MIIYKVNDSYQVMPDKNLVNTMRLEPRIMKLLVYLIHNQGKLVSREEIISTIWEGYPGGEEGMNQAISQLRKIFADHDRKLIETIPKSGYIFNASVEKVPDVKITAMQAEDQTISITHNKNGKRLWVYINFGLIIIVAILILYLFFGDSKENMAPEMPVREDAPGGQPSFAPKAFLMDSACLFFV